MTALELADYMENTERWNVAAVRMQDCAEMLRAQHKAIKTLREALHSISRMSYAASAQERVATAALAETENLT